MIIFFISWIFSSSMTFQTIIYWLSRSLLSEKRSTGTVAVSKTSGFG